MAAARSPRFTLHIDPVLALLVAILLLLGLTMMTSASVAVAERTMGSPLYYLQRQSVFLVLALFGAGVFLLIPTRFWAVSGFLSLTVALLLLIVVLLPGIGHTVNGATRWIDLGPMNFQVSEVARLLMFFYICSYLVRHGDAMRQSLMGFARPMLFVFVACALLLVEPDFGAATVLLGTTLVVMFIGGVRLRDYALLVIVAISAMVVLILTSPYRLKRFLGFLEPFDDPYDSGFQLTQSLIAIGRGEWTGVGLGASVQKLHYLPEAHTDFVFAVMAEELGLIGTVIVVALFFALVARGFAIARRAARHKLMFQSYLAYTLVTWFALQSFINIGVNMGILPTKGLTLPMVSYGGSSLIATLASVALLLRVHHETHAVEKAALSATRVDSRGPMQ
ncbi:MAG: putative lipid II flippase FtsW [Gammaproteobacteria bacterium]